MNAANVSYVTTHIGSVMSSLGQPWLAFSSICKPLQKYLIKLSDLQFDGTHFHFNRPLELTLYRDGAGGWNCESDSLSVLAFGDTAEDAVHSLAEDVSVLWDEIAQARDEELSPEAQNIKRFLLGAVESVKER